MTIEVGDTIIRFGKHKGVPLREVPMSYLEWCFENNVGGPDGFTAIAAFLGRYVPSGKAMSHERIPDRKPIKTRNKPSKPIDHGNLDCSHMFNPDADWPDRQEWDGITPPWLDQSGAMDDEFKALFG